MDGQEIENTNSEQPTPAPAPEESTRRVRVKKIIAELEQTVAKQNARLEQERDRMLRLAAEYDNYRRRTQNEYRLMLQTAGERIITALLPVLDDFDRMLNAPASDVESIRQGAGLIQRKLMTALQNEGLAVLTVVGQPFDPQFCDAVAETPDPEKPVGTVVTEVEKGYRLGDKIIRHAKVVVSRAPEEAGGENG